MNGLNFVAYAAQVTALVLMCAALPRLLGLRSPGVQYAFWRVLLLLCLILPFIQPWRPVAATLVLAPDLAAAPQVHLLPRVQSGSQPRVSFNYEVATVGRDIILAGIVIRLGWMAFGLTRLRRMRRRATELAEGFDELKDTIGAATPILWSAEVRHPVTFGLFDPVVLLPVALQRADMAAQRAVVAHELHHVQRRDWGWIVGEELVRSVFWFHPAIWWLVSRVQLARETVVDELSILVTNARRTYLDTLLAFADDTGLASSPAFSARRHLFHRVMLLSKEGQMSSGRVAVGSCVLLLALGAGSWGAVNAFPLYGAVQRVQAQTPPRDPVTAEKYHGTAAALMEKAMKDTSLSPAEKLQTILKGIAAEDRALAVNPDYISALVYKNVLLRMQATLSSDPQELNDLIRQADELRNRALALQAAGARDEIATFQRPQQAPPPPPPPPPPPATAASAAFLALVDQLNPIRIGGNIKPPTKLRDVKPVYPAEARAYRVQGVVIVEAVIDEAGKIRDARVLRSIPMLDEAALEAVRQWEFVPTLLNGTPSPVLMTMAVNFTLQ